MRVATLKNLCIVQCIYKQFLVIATHLSVTIVAGLLHAVVLYMMFKSKLPIDPFCLLAYMLYVALRPDHLTAQAVGLSRADIAFALVADMLTLHFVLVCFSAKNRRARVFSSLLPRYPPLFPSSSSLP